jgi:tetratricopeptide (TPR) repeat protein
MPFARRALWALLLSAAAFCPAGAEGGAPGKRSPVDAAIDVVKPPGKFDEDVRAELKSKVAALLQETLKSNEQIVKYLKTAPQGDVHDTLMQIVSGGLIGAMRQASRGAPPPVGFEVGAQMAREWQRRHPDDPTANRDLGAYEYYKGDYRSAVRSFDRAYQEGERSAELYAQYADAALHLGDYETAAAAALMALKLDPGNKDAMAVYQFSKGRSPTINLPNSLGAGPSTADLSPASSPPPVAESPTPAGALAAAPSSEAAQAQARSAALAKDAVSAMRVRDYPQAYQAANQAVALNPSNAQAVNYRAMALAQMNRYPEAIADATAALALTPGNAAVLHTRSWSLAKLGRYPEALQDARAAAMSEPNNAILYQDQAFALAGLRDRSGALDALRRSADLDPRFAPRLERGLQLPETADMTLLFDDGAPAASAPAPAPRQRQHRFLRLLLLSASGGLLVALGVLHVVSSSWRETMRATVRRVIGAPPPRAGVSVADAPLHAAFWTQYELVKEIGLGGMGVVYEATDRSLERRVAVKKMRDEIRADADDRRNFINEARLVAQLHHPNIVDIYGIVEDGTDVYLVFEFVPGRTLADALKADGPVDLPRALSVIKEVAAAVAHAHERGIIHRDLKPSNVMLTPEGRVKVMDFGVARQAKDAVTRRTATGSVAGTPAYMAPEQEQGAVRRESDVYALAVCLYEMATGELPFAGHGAAMLLNKLNGRHIPPSQRSGKFSADFDAVMARALAPSPDSRYHTPAELVAAVEALPSLKVR